MKFTFSTLVIFMLSFLALTACQNTIIKDKTTVIRYGILASENNSSSVELALTKYNNWTALTKRIQQIVCNDSLPKVTFKSKNRIKTIYFRNPCQKNQIEVMIHHIKKIKIHNDSIIKSNRVYPLDSLDMVLKETIKNNNENSERIIFTISYDNTYDNLLSTLDKLTDSYHKITTKTDIKIGLGRFIEIPIPLLPK